jgi:hypothetical protein
VPEVLAFRAEVEHGAEAAGRALHAVRLTARLNACVAADGRRARGIVGLPWHRYWDAVR